MHNVGAVKIVQGGEHLQGVGGVGSVGDVGGVGRFGVGVGVGGVGGFGVGDVGCWFW